jgi:hypothetical protein
MSAFEDIGFQRMSQPVAHTPLAGRAMIDRRIFPKCAYFINQRQAITAGDGQGRQTVQWGRVRVQDIRLNLRNDFGQPSRQASDNRDLI